MTDRNNDNGLFWHKFLYEINRATASLFYLLQGMETVRKEELAAYDIVKPAQRPFAPCFAKLSYLPVPLSMSGTGFDLNYVLRREGEAEQMAFKGWVEQVYFLWESQFRNQLKERLRGADIIRPEGDAIGDFRLVRNDLIHNDGVASSEYSGKCRVLNWFTPGEPIIIGTRHVLDFLNQMGFLTRTPGFLDDGSAAAWTIFPGMERELAKRPAPNLISFRMSIDNQLEDGSSWHVASVVFENGVFANIPVYYADDGKSLAEHIEFLSESFIDGDGNLVLATGIMKDREILYKEAVIALSGRGHKIEGLGVPGPAFRIRKD